jgi:hypothetical protein
VGFFVVALQVGILATKLTKELYDQHETAVL